MKRSACGDAFHPQRLVAAPVPVPMPFGRRRQQSTTRRGAAGLDGESGVARAPRVVMRPRLHRPEGLTICTSVVTMWYFLSHIKSRRHGCCSVRAGAPASAGPRPAVRHSVTFGGGWMSGLQPSRGSRLARVLASTLALALLLLPRAVHAQAVTGTIFGTVTDNSGAVMPGVTVTVTNVDTGRSRDLRDRRQRRVHRSLHPDRHLQGRRRTAGLQERRRRRHHA